MVLDNAENNKRIAKNTFFLYGRMLVVLFVSIYTTRVVLDVLGIEDYGIYNVVCGFVSMFGFLNTSLSNGIQRFYNYEYAKNGEIGAKRVFQTAFQIQLFLAILVVVLVEGIGIWYINHQMVISADRLVAANWVFQFSVLSLLLVILQIPYSAAILAHERMDYYAVVSIVDIFLKLGVILALPYQTGDQLIIYGVLQVFVSFLDFILYYSYSKKHFEEIVFEKVFHKELFRSIFTFSGWNVLATFAWMTQGQGVNMVINLFFGTYINAARGISGQIQSAIQGFCENLIIAFRPQLVCSYAQGNMQRTERMMYSMSKIMFLMFFMLSTPVIFEIDYVLNFWLGDNIPDYTASFTILVLLSMYPRNFSMAFAQVVHATGCLGTYQICSAIVILLALPLSYIALKLGTDAISVYWINLAICLLMFVVCLRVLKRVFPINVVNYIRRVILPCFLIGTIVPTAIYFLIQTMSESFIRLCVTTFVCTVLTVVLSYFIVLDNDEKQLIKKIIKK